MGHTLNTFNSIYKEFYPMVLQLCTGFAKGDKSLANDLCQEVFINAWNALEKFRSQSSYKTWLYRITVNTCLKHFRNQKARPMAYIEETPNWDKPDEAEQASAAAETAHHKLYQHIGLLGKVDRLLIMLILDGVQYPQIAEIMGISEANVRVRVHRVKQKLKNLFNND